MNYPPPPSFAQPALPPQPPNAPPGWVWTGTAWQQVAPPGPPPAPPGPPPGMVMQPQVTTMPQYQMDDAAIMAAFQKSEVQQKAAMFGPKPIFLKLPGPDGTGKWDRAPINFTAEAAIWICPNLPGKPLFVDQATHYFRSAQHPRGMSIEHTEPQCAFCDACVATENDPRMPDDAKKRAHEFGRVRRKRLYNAINLSNPSIHYNPEDGSIRSAILEAGAGLQTAIMELVKTAGRPALVFEFGQGRALIYSKTKTGPMEMDVEYGLRFREIGPAQPFPPELNVIANNLMDLDKLITHSTPETVQAAITELGFVRGGPPTAAFQTQPQAPWMPPAGFSQPAPYPMGPTAPQAAPPWAAPPPPTPVQQAPAWAVPPAPAQQAPAWAAPPPAPVQQTLPWAAPQAAPMQTPPPPYQGAPWPAQAAPPAPPAGIPPPPMMSSAGIPPPPVAYLAQPSQPPPVVVTEPRELKLPLDPSLRLADARHECFGKCEMVDHLCQTCPSWIQSQCQAQTPGFVPGQAGAGALPQLAAALAGK